MGQLDDKTALVTGSSSGIGFAIARRFAAEGASVYLTGRREAELGEAVARIGARATAVRGDVSDLGDLDRVYAAIAQQSGDLDVVVANAGVGSHGLLGAITEEELDRTVATNLKGTVFTVQKALPLLRAGASVVLVSSTATLRPTAGLGVYAATKAAVRSLARTWAAELAGRGIRVNALTPGTTETSGLSGLLAEFPDPGQEAETQAATPLGRAGHPDEVAAGALYLASSQSSFTTGTELFVDGGLAQL